MCDGDGPCVAGIRRIFRDQQENEAVVNKLLISRFGPIFCLFFDYNIVSLWSKFELTALVIE